MSIYNTVPNKIAFQDAIGRSAYWLIPVVYAVSGLAFALDLVRDDTLAYGVIYVPLIATAVFHRSRVGLWILSTVACLMVMIGALFPVVESDLPDMIGNRFLSILAIVATTAFVRHARNIQERLAAETRRAEAAEKIKTDVLSNLSHEIRTPLHTLLGVLSLTMAHSRPDQQEALRRIRCDGKELMAAIDNLLDLTQFEERQLRQQTIDVATIARAAADSARAAARERQINIALTPNSGAGPAHAIHPDHDTHAEDNTAPEPKIGTDRGIAQDRESSQATAIGDSWATRRVLDNLLANAVRLTPPGGTVSVSVARNADMVTASVTDAGKGLPPGLMQDFLRESPEARHSSLSTTGGMGLALSRRLALAMNARMIASNEPGPGATVSLSLPAADRHALGSSA